MRHSKMPLDFFISKLIIYVNKYQMVSIFEFCVQIWEDILNVLPMTLYLRNSQEVWGSPMYPSGQVQTGRWLTTLQKALRAHGSFTAQGLMHFLFSHAV